MKRLAALLLDTLVDSSPSVVVRVALQMLLDQCLAVLDAVEVRQVVLVIDLSSRKEGISILFISAVSSSFVQQHGLLLVAFSLDLKSTNSHLKQLVLPLCIQSLFVVKLLLFSFKFLFLFLDLDFLQELLLLLLVVECILPHLVDRNLQL